MALEDLTPFGTLPKAYQGLLGVDEAAALQKRAQIQGLLGAGLALAKGMSSYGPPRSALQNILGAVAGGFESSGNAYEGGIKQRMSAQQMQQQQRMMQGAEQLKMRYPDLATMIDTNLPGAMRIIADMEQEKRQPKLTSAKPGEVLVDPTGKVIYQAPMGEGRQGGVLTKEESATLGLPANVMYQRTVDGKIVPIEGTTVAAAKAPEVREFADGTTRQWDNSKGWVIVARKPREAGAAKTMYASQPTVDASGRLVFLPTEPGRPILDAQTGRPVNDFKPAVKQIQLPAAIQKQEDEDYDRGQTAINIATDSNRYVNAIRSGAIPFGFGSSTSASVRGALGSNDPSVINKKDFEAFKVRLVNESLRLNKGTQTDTDAKRAVDELQAANSATGAAKAINTLMEINLRAANDAQNAIIRRRRNSKLGDPEVPLDVPKFEPHTFTQTDVNNLLKDPKYPKGTIFVDPDGVRRVKQ